MGRYASVSSTGLCYALARLERTFSKATRLSLQDVVAPKSTMEVKVFMQHSKDITAATAAECKDKFLIQSTPVPADWVCFHLLSIFMLTHTAA